jgi:hypothetical protein
MRITLLTLALVLGCCGAVKAEEPVSSFADLWMRLKSGDRVFVIDGAGQETVGVFARVSNSTLSLLVDGQMRELPSTEVREIARRGDSLLNGFLIGAGIGAVLEAAAFADCDEVFEECLHPAAAAAVGGVVFGGIGALIDHFIKGRTVVFRVKSTALRLQPTVSVAQNRTKVSIALSTR